MADVDEKSDEHKTPSKSIVIQSSKDREIETNKSIEESKDGTQPAGSSLLSVIGDMFKRALPADDNAAAKDHLNKSTSSTNAIELTHSNLKLNCDCEKDARFKFACKEGVKWFTGNEVIIKIRRKQKENNKVDVSEIINEEYTKCRKHYQCLKKLQPRQETQTQIERDLKRTFPKNAFFQNGQKG